MATRTIRITPETFIYNKDTKTFFTNEKCLGMFSTEYELLNPKTGGVKLFKFTSMTGSEWDPKTITIYTSSDGIQLHVSQDEKLTKQRADAYLKAKLRY
jgi:hypothetical protein